MTTLIVEELRSTLSQSFTLSLNQRSHIYAIKPNIYMHNAPSGTFTFTIKSGGDSLGSVSFTSSDIKTDLSTSNNYAHIRKGLIFSNPIALKNGSYTLELSSSGYTYSSGSFIGWIKDYENIFIDVTGSATTDFDNGQTFYLYSLREI